MNIGEVQDTFFDYQGKRTQYILETQAFFLKKHVNPYVWMDEKHQLHVKVKLPRGQVDSKDELYNIHEVSDLFLEEQGDLNLIWVNINTECDQLLPEKIRCVMVIEMIYERCKNVCE